MAPKAGDVPVDGDSKKSKLSPNQSIMPEAGQVHLGKDDTMIHLAASKDIHSEEISPLTFDNFPPHR